MGTVLLAINQGDVLLSSRWPGALAWKVPLTYLVPFLVATWGALLNVTWPALRPRPVQGRMSAHEPTVGVIGLKYGRAHIPAFQASGCRVVAVCQRDQAGAKAIADRYGVPRVYGSQEQMIDEARPEIVVIATPPVTHHAMALRAFAAGAHVLCEKPLAVTRAQAQDMVDAAARPAASAWPLAVHGGDAAVHATVGEGVVGRVFNLAARWLGSRLADEKAAPSWRQDRAQAGHGAMRDMGAHVIGLNRWNFGEFRHLVVDSGIAYPARTAPGVDHPADVEDHCSVLAELTSGAQVAFTVSRVAHGTNDQSLEAWGSGGAIRYRLTREGSRWFEGELAVSPGGPIFRPWRRAGRRRPRPARATRATSWAKR